MLYRNEPIKVAGVTFGERQKNLSRLFKKAERLGWYDFGVELRPFEFEGAPAFGFYFDGLDVGNVPAESVPFVSEILPTVVAFEPVIRLNNQTIDEWRLTMDAPEDFPAEIAELEDFRIYSATIRLVQELPDPEPDPANQKKKRGLFGRLKKK